VAGDDDVVLGDAINLSALNPVLSFARAETGPGFFAAAPGTGSAGQSNIAGPHFLALVGAICAFKRA